MKQLQVIDVCRVDHLIRLFYDNGDLFHIPVMSLIEYGNDDDIADFVFDELDEQADQYGSRYSSEYLAKIVQDFDWADYCQELIEDYNNLDDDIDLEEVFVWILI